MAAQDIVSAHAVNNKTDMGKCFMFQYISYCRCSLVCVGHFSSSGNTLNGGVFVS